jgi:PAS domain-containing protein
MSANIYDPAFRDHDVVRRLDVGDEVRSQEAVRVAGALQTAIFNSVNFSSIVTDAKGVIQIFNVGAERMLGYTAAEVMNQITPAYISDPQEVIARAKALSVELGTPITPGFEALVFKASRGIEDIYELTYIRKDGSRFPAGHHRGKRRLDSHHSRRVPPGTLTLTSDAHERLMPL